MAQSYPGTINIKYLALFKSYENGAMWKLYTGKGRFTFIYRVTGR